MKTLSYILLTFGLVVGFAATALAATNPGEATTDSSVGSSDINITIPVLYKISNIDDLPSSGRSTYNGSDTYLLLTDEVCVYTNNSSTTYKVTLNGTSTSGTNNNKFYVSNGTQDIPYSTYWTGTAAIDSNTIPATNYTDDIVGAKGGASATTATALNGYTDIDCGSNSTNARVSVRFDKADLLAVKGGDYDGTLSITIIPPT